MHDFEKYKNDGWGLSRQALQELDKLLSQCISEKNSARILEFGSGSSTKYFVGAVIENNWQDKVEITSFDDNRAFMPTFEAASVDSFLHLLERELVECSDSSFEKMFSERRYDKTLMNKKTTELNTRQRNNFYDIKPDDLYGEYDVVVLDGPHGNGRSISFLHIQDYLSSPCHVLIDDHTHHDFETRMLQTMEGNLITENKSNKPSRSEKLLATFSAQKKAQQSPWVRGGNFVVYQVRAS